MCLFEHVTLITGLEGEPETSSKKKKSLYIIDKNHSGPHVWNEEEWRKDYERRKEEDKRKAQERREKRLQRAARKQQQ